MPTWRNEYWWRNHLHGMNIGGAFAYF